MTTSLVLAFTISLFVVGCLGMLLTQKHLLIILLSLELLLLASTSNFVLGSLLLDDLFGQIYGLAILALAASETALGLALLVGFYRRRGGISVDLLNILRP
jgi:NADH-quinone oxidoreductase subunit K